MSQSIKKPEIMAPAGNWTCLEAAIQAGADAIYFGIDQFSMRATKNGSFPSRDLSRVIKRCHKSKVRAYLTLNTIVYENELTSLRKVLERAARAGVDAVICWDFAVITAAREAGIPIHISTQMSISNSESLQHLCKQFDIERVVLARECSLAAIKKIIRQTEKAGLQVEIESFVHGAMCISISGRCFMSEYVHGKSANRGQCLQPCRREFHVEDRAGKMDLVMGSDYVMSPKDLCALPFLEKLIETGIHCFKIEGRNRSPEYVSAVTRAYRQCVDSYVKIRGKKNWLKNWAEIKEEALAKVGEVYNRGFSNGYFFGKPAQDWVDAAGNNASTKKVQLGVVLNYYKKQGVVYIRIDNGEIQMGDEFYIQGERTGIFRSSCQSLLKDSKPVSKAVKGDLVTIKINHSARKNDQVYIVKNA